MIIRLILIICLTVFFTAIATCEYYAVLITGDDPITGMGVGQDPCDRFWNDTFVMWEALFKFGWKNDNIYVLFAGGSDWNTIYSVHYNRYWGNKWNINPYYISSITDNSCTQANIISTFNSLNSIMTDDDFLFVWVMCHGGYYINGNPPYHAVDIWGGSGESSKMSDTELAQWLPDNYNRRLLWFAQCYGGGFIPHVQNSATYAMSACEYDWESYQADDNDPDGGDNLENEVFNYQGQWEYYHHNEFNYHIINALLFETIGEFNSFDDHDLNEDGLASAEEIYLWDDSKVSTPYENPVYSDPGNIGDEIFLNIPPYPPQNLTHTIDTDNHPILHWDLNTEYDISEYNIYRDFWDRYTGSYGVELIAVVDHPTHQYKDYDVVFNPNLQSGAYYRLKAVDLAGNLSYYSDGTNMRAYVPQSSDSLIMAISESGSSSMTPSPNPFNNSTTITFNLPKAGEISLKVFDISGREVQSLVTGHSSLGTHSVVWDAKDCASGLYFVQLEAEGYVKTQKVVLLK